jgi:hypothetical protein
MTEERKKERMREKEELKKETIRNNDREKT